MKKLQILTRLTFLLLCSIAISGCLKDEPSAADLKKSFQEAYGCAPEVIDSISILNVIPNDENTMFVDFEWTFVSNVNQKITSFMNETKLIKDKISELRRIEGPLESSYIQATNEIKDKYKSLTHKTEEEAASILLNKYGKAPCHNENIKAVEDVKDEYRRIIDEKKITARSDLDKDFEKRKAALEFDHKSIKEKLQSEGNLYAKNGFGASQEYKNKAYEHQVKLEKLYEDHKNNIQILAFSFSVSDPLSWKDPLTPHKRAIPEIVNLIKEKHQRLDDVKNKHRACLEQFNSQRNELMLPLKNIENERDLKLKELDSSDVITRLNEVKNEIRSLKNKLEEIENSYKSAIYSTPLNQCIVKSSKQTAKLFQYGVDDEVTRVLNSLSVKMYRDIFGHSIPTDLKETYKSKSLMIKTKNGWRFYNASTLG